MHEHPRFWVLALVAAAVLAAWPAGARAETSNEDCLSCHEDSKIDGSIHGDVSVSCTDCHADLAAVEMPHDEKVAAAQCASCHDKAVTGYQKGVHRIARKDGKGPAASCASCHGLAHAVRASGDRKSPTHPLNLIATCAKCHDDPKVISTEKLPGGVVQEYVDSIHGRAVKEAGLVVAPTCASCHGAHDVRLPKDPESSMGRANQAATCGKCHEGIVEKYAGSVHEQAVKKGDAKAPVCSDCHTAHGIQSSEATKFKLDVVAECGTCHEESMHTYRDTFHGHVTELGFARMAKCADCHGAHDIAAMDDPRSRVVGANLVETCRSCHPTATQSFTQYDPHADPSDKKRSAPLYYTALAMKGLLAGVLGFFGLHTLLWLGRGLTDKMRGGH
jgi:nitrate/TMAO reductase-like tetraheme cytochrome c subunit